jgi:hypothetical protein
VYANDVLGGSSSSSGSSVPLIATTKVSSTGARLLFPDQTYGWFGLGVDMFRPSWSLVHDTFTKAGTDGFTFGVDVAEWNNTEPNKAGEIHWGTVPEDTYIGDL